MADITLVATSPLAGHDETIGTVRIRERPDLHLISVAIPLGNDKDTGSALSAACHLDMPTPAVSTINKGTRAFASAADQIMLMFESEASAQSAADALSSSTYVVDQTDTWAKIEISGDDVLAALERLIPVDLHPALFQVNASARTIAEHMGVVVIRTDKTSYLLLSAASSARSFLHALQVSAANVA